MCDVRTLLLTLVAAAATTAAEPIVLETCDEQDSWRVTRKPATVEAADDAAQGSGAIRVTMPGMVARTMARSYVPGSAEWDGYQGLSFWVKGDGSDQFGCLAVQGRYAYATYFPLSNTEWHKVTRSWYDFVPESQVDPIGTLGAMPPSGINTLRLGSRWTITHNNARIPPHSYCIDQIQLEETAPVPAPPPAPRPFSDVLKDLREQRPVRIQCMGDSITAGTSLPDRDAQRYAVRTQELLRRWLESDNIHCSSRAVGGAKLTDARAWVPRDFVPPAPDLVTIWYGYNDKSNAFTADYFQASLNDYIDRVCSATHGTAAILLFATGPGTGPRFVMMDDYAERVRSVAKQRGLPCFDIHAILKAVGREHIQELFADMAHPNEAGHQLIADSLCEFIVKAAGIDTPKPPPPPKPDVPPVTPHTWTFEDDAADWRFDGFTALSPDAASSGSTSVRFNMTEIGKDHDRAWSPVIPVVPGQEIDVQADMLVKQIDSDSGFGLYVCTYPAADGTGDFKVHRIAGGSLAPDWVRLKGNVTIPAGAKSMKVMLWAHKETTGLFYVDTVSVAPAD
jgi:lysophospholipase L1-like esterase